METDISTVRYAIDAEDRICAVDDAWGHFAAANDGADDLASPAVLGQSLWAAISDAATRTLYQQIVARIRSGQSAQFTLRCDGPSCRRLLEMSIAPGRDGVVHFETRTLSAIDRAPETLLSRAAPRSTDLVRICAWCNQVDIGGDVADWVEVEAAAEHLRIFEHGVAPQLTHGACEPCVDRMLQKIESMEPAAAG